MCFYILSSVFHISAKVECGKWKTVFYDGYYVDVRFLVIRRGGFVFFVGKCLRDLCVALMDFWRNTFSISLVQARTKS